MPATRHPHIFLKNREKSLQFTMPQAGRAQIDIPQVNRKEHSAKLKKQWNGIWDEAKKQDASRTAVSQLVKGGVHVQFESAPGFELNTKSLEDRRNGIQLSNIRKIPTQNNSGEEITKATVFIPTGKQSIFLKKLESYAEEDTPTGKPKHKSLIQSIDNIRTALLESLWTDKGDLMPTGSTPCWCEIWLSSEKKDIVGKFRNTAALLGIEIKNRILQFPERSVLLGYATRDQLSQLMHESPDIAEFRRAKETPRFFLELENREQAEWGEDLTARLVTSNKRDVSVCVLDTGANNGHPLLKPLLALEDCQSVEPDWSAADKEGHGTLMCGLSAYGDLKEVLQSAGSVEIQHKLESVKILPDNNSNSPDLYGDMTIQGISRAEVQSPTTKRISCMAVTATDNRDRGKPSSWSAAIDKVTSGYKDDSKRLVIISGGNVVGQEEWNNYPESNLKSSIHDPGQSWNALTVGAYTTKANISDPDLDEHNPVAQPDALSPFSSTSQSWEPRWPIKPEIVLEGGNLLRAPDGFIGDHEDLSLLSTNNQPQKSHFEMVNATSAATALAGRMAAQIQCVYPDAWPETIRGLMVHSATWTDKLKNQFRDSGNEDEISKTEAGRLLRICGYGVPDRDKALSCLSSSLTLVSENEIQPYHKPGDSYSTKDMHMHDIPWPKQELLRLGNTPVKLRITLSYFIEPGPGEVGWSDRYRYPSFGLRFDLNLSSETEKDFTKRLNKAAREQDYKRDKTGNGSHRWILGSKNRNVGSIHSDIWKGTAAEIATCNFIGVYPIIGWWRESDTG